MQGFPSSQLAATCSHPVSGLQVSVVQASPSLQSVGVWAKVQSRIVPAENVRQALQYAETNNVSAALVARSLMPGHDVRWVLVPAKLHRPITQTLGVVKAGQQDAAARRFAAYLTGPAQECLRRCGFETPRELRARR